MLNDFLVKNVKVCWFFMILIVIMILSYYNVKHICQFHKQCWKVEPNVPSFYVCFAVWRRNREPRKRYESQRVKNSSRNGLTRLTKLLQHHGVSWRFMSTTVNIQNTEPLLTNLAPLKRLTPRQQNLTRGSSETLLKPVENFIICHMLLVFFLTFT